MEKVRVGVIGLGSIFHRVMTDFHNAENCELYAVAARDIARAREAAARYGAQRAFGSYEELAACPEVELVYVATPHSHHLAHALLCLEHGKHVLCEKAFAVSSYQAADMLFTAQDDGLFLMEAMWTRFLPAMRKLCALRDAGELGEIRHVTSDFAYNAPFDPKSRLYDPALAGGAMLDVGIYPLSISSMLLGPELEKAQGMCVKAPTGVDARTVVNLRYKCGATAQFLCAIDAPGDSKMTVFGTKARVDIPDFWHATRLEITRDGKPEILEFPPETEGHHHQFVHAAECIRKGQTESPIMPHDETLRLMKIMTDILHINGIVYPCE